MLSASSSSEEYEFVEVADRGLGGTASDFLTGVSAGPFQKEVKNPAKDGFCRRVAGGLTAKTTGEAACEGEDFLIDSGVRILVS